MLALIAVAVGLWFLGLFRILFLDNWGYFFGLSKQNPWKSPSPGIKRFSFVVSAIVMFAAVATALAAPPLLAGAIAAPFVTYAALVPLLSGLQLAWSPIARWRVRRAERRVRDRQLRHERKMKPLQDAAATLQREKVARERQQMSYAQRRREEIRLRCEVLYDRYAAEIQTRFPRTMLEDYLKRYLGDARAVEEVEHFGAQLQDLIQFHVAKVEPPKRCRNVEELSKWYMEEKRRIEHLDIDPAFRETYLIQLNMRYAELTQELLSEFTP